MSLFCQVIRITDVLDLVEEFTGSANHVVACFLAGGTRRYINTLVYTGIVVARDAYEQCQQAVIDRHVWALEAEAAVQLYENQLAYGFRRWEHEQW